MINEQGHGELIEGHKVQLRTKNKEKFKQVFISRRFGGVLGAAYNKSIHDGV